MMTVFGIKSCDTCRKTRSFLDARSIDYTFHDLRDDGLDIQKLERWADKVGWEQLLNKRSLTWRKIPEADRSDLSRGKALALMLDNPTLVKRPVIEDDKFTSVGFSEKRFTAFLDK
ncbi:MAG: arsenate reductase [Woeseiaceae bacterium]|nr:arsenate reductase [Woeseiaceae bacterium]